MSSSIDYAIATSQQIQNELCTRLERLRLSRNRTQAQVAKAAGISTRTLARLENGEGVSLDTFLRVLKALDLEGNLDTLVPDTSVQPILRVRNSGRERKRARPPTTPAPEEWTWGDGSDGSRE